MTAATPRSCDFLGEQLDDLLAALTIERGGRFVDQQQRGAGHQSARDADALAFAAGQLVRAGGWPCVPCRRPPAARPDRGSRPCRRSLVTNRSCSIAVRAGIRLPDWNTKPMRSRRIRLRWLGVAATRSMSSTRTSPEVGVVSAPATASRLDLPEPEGPTIAMSSPGRDGQRDLVERAHGVVAVTEGQCDVVEDEGRWCGREMVHRWSPSADSGIDPDDADHGRRRAGETQRDQQDRCRRDGRCLQGEGHRGGGEVGAHADAGRDAHGRRSRSAGAAAWVMLSRRR